MRPNEILIAELEEKYGEYLEMAGQDAPALLIQVLSQKLVEQIEINALLKKRLQNYGRIPINF